MKGKRSEARSIRPPSSWPVCRDCAQFIVVWPHTTALTDLPARDSSECALNSTGPLGQSFNQRALCCCSCAGLTTSRLFSFSFSFSLSLSLSFSPLAPFQFQGALCRLGYETKTNNLLRHSLALAGSRLKSGKILRSSCVIKMNCRPKQFANIPAQAEAAVS